MTQQPDLILNDKWKKQTNKTNTQTKTKQNKTEKKKYVIKWSLQNKIKRKRTIYEHIKIVTHNLLLHMENAIEKTNHPSDPWITARTCVYQYNDVTISNCVTGYSILWAAAERSKILDLEGFSNGKWRTWATNADCKLGDWQGNIVLKRSNPNPNPN